MLLSRWDFKPGILFPSPASDISFVAYRRGDLDGEKARVLGRERDRPIPHGSGTDPDVTQDQAHGRRRFPSTTPE